MHGRAASDDRHVMTLPHQFRLARPDHPGGHIQIRHRHAAQAQIDRTVMHRRPFHRRWRFPRIGRRDDGQGVQRPQPGDIFNRMVRRPQLAIIHARGLRDQLHIETSVSDVCLDLFQRAAGQKARGAGHERNLPAIRQSRANPDHTLLGDADSDHAVRIFLLKAVELGRADRVIDHRDDAGIFGSQSLQGGDPGVPAILETNGAGGCMGHQTNSSIAWANCAALGMPWCQFALFSMNETPLPLTVLAITANGAVRPIQTRLGFPDPKQRRAVQI